MGFLKTGKSDLQALPAFINTPLFWIANIENFFLRMGFSLPFGVSLFAVAKKPGTDKKPEHKTLSAFARYLVVGLLNTALGYGAILASSHWLGFSYLWANVTGYAFGLVNAFFWQKKWVFRSRGLWRSEILPFLAVFGAGFLVNLLVVLILGEFTALDKNLCQLAGIASYTTTNFLGNKVWTFGRRKK
ncbi:MAG: GtrA family protein [Spirochaetia bacterium]|nr:GtrA family protein [Spirochaetia bacterium]